MTNHALITVGWRDRLATVRRDGAAREIVRSWRDLTSAADGGGRVRPLRRTLVGVSGGADSMALLLALRAATRQIAVGHVVHVLRTEAEELEDRDFVRASAASLGLPFLEATIDPPPRQNMEAGARRLRYEALARMAHTVGAPFVASAHHADDQLESTILALTRGAGPGGLAGVAPRRRIAPGAGPGRPGVTLIRPMLRVTRAEAQRICALAGVEWREDRTNLDGARARAALRARVTPALESLRPGAARRAARAAELLREADEVVRDRAAAVFGDVHRWRRDALRAERPIVLGAGLRAALKHATNGGGADRLGARRIDPVVRAIRDLSTEPREFRFEGAVVLVTARDVVLSTA